MVEIRGHRYLKQIFMGLALIMLILIFLWPVPPSQQVQNKNPEEEKLNLVVNPRLHSVDHKGSPYDIKAETAQRNDSDGRIVLSIPEGTMTLNSGQKLGVESKSAILCEKGENLDLDGKVCVQSEDGYRIETEKAQINVRDKTAETHHPVKGKSPQGDLTAEGLQIDTQGNIALKGKTHMTFNVHEGHD